MKGKRVIAGILLVGILATALAGCKNADVTKKEREKPVITLGSDSYPPYNYLNEDGIPTGIDVELATEAFRRMGYQVDVVQINWEKKKELVESGEIDCIMGCFSMEGRLDDYRWAGPYIASRQVVAVNESSDIYKLSDLEGKNLAVQSTTKPEGIFLNRTDERIPKLGNLISLGHRELIYTFLGKGYVDAVAAHEESIVQYMKEIKQRDYSHTDSNQAIEQLDSFFFFLSLNIQDHPPPDTSGDHPDIFQRFSSSCHPDAFLPASVPSAHRFLCHRLLQKRHLFR